MHERPTGRFPNRSPFGPDCVSILLFRGKCTQPSGGPAHRPAAPARLWLRFLCYFLVDISQVYLSTGLLLKDAVLAFNFKLAGIGVAKHTRRKRRMDASFIVRV